MSSQAEMPSNLTNGSWGRGCETLKEIRKAAKHRKSVIIRQKVEKFNTMDSTLVLEQNVHIYFVHCSSSADLRYQLPVVNYRLYIFP